MAEKPWIKWFSSDFLNGVGASNMGPEEIGIYAVVLSLMADRGAPIDDDRAWIARKAGTSTRKAGMILDKLIDLGKIEKRGGMLGNARMIREISKRDGKSEKARAAAIARWHGDNQPELDLAGGDAEKAGSRDLSPEYPRDKSEIIPEKNTEKKTQKPRKSAVSDDADAFSPSRARVIQTPEARIIQSTDHLEPPRVEPEEPAPPSRLDDRDLQALFDACSVASGYNPIQPGHIAKALDMVKGWRDAGIDFDEVVIPTIKHVIANSPDPTSSFARFDKRIRHEHARRGAQPKNGAAYKAPAVPIVEGVDGEDARCVAIRRALLDRLGPALYCTMVNEIRLQPVHPDEMGDNDKRRPIRVITKRVVGSIMNGEHASVLRNAARSQGFTDVW